MESLLNILKNLDLTRILLGLAVLTACLIAVRSLMRLFSALLSRSAHIDPALHSVLKTALRILLYFISVVFSAGAMGVPVSSFLAVFSVVGLAVSLAVQGVLSNLAGGVIILASKPFSLGDYIETDSLAGTVKEIGFLHTRLSASDGKMIFVPNNLLYNSKLVNCTSSGLRRIELRVGMRYECDPAQVRLAALSAVAATEGVLSEPAPEVLLENYAENAVEYVVRLWVRAENYLRVRYALNEALYAAFQTHGVPFAAPRMNVHID